MKKYILSRIYELNTSISGFQQLIDEDLESSNPREWFRNETQIKIDKLKFAKSELNKVLKS